jgi:glyoxylase-like metal-dependent hydrolase (beta-lactamase superfamily II)
VEPIPLADDEIVPLDAVAPGVVGLSVLFVNVFGIQGEDGWTLIDGALHGSAGRITRWAAKHFGDRPPDSIVLTHAHFDHIGAVGELARSWGVPVYAHREEIPYVTGQRAYPPPDPSVGGGMMARMSGLYPRGPFELDNVRELPADGSVPGLESWEIIHTPGHTAGHVSLFRPADRALIVGDAFCTTKAESFFKAHTQPPELHGPPAYFTTDWDAARESVAQLARLEPMFMAPGHGRPMAGEDTIRALATLAERFDLVARPEQGRYVEHPVRT